MGAGFGEGGLLAYVGPTPVGRPRDGRGLSALAAVVALALLPRDQLAGQIGLAIVGIGVVATFIAEVPTTVRVARGGPMPRGYVYRSGSLGE